MRERERERERERAHTYWSVQPRLQASKGTRESQRGVPTMWNQWCNVKDLLGLHPDNSVIIVSETPDGMMFDPIQIQCAMRQMSREEGFDPSRVFYGVNNNSYNHFVAGNEPNFRVTSLRLLDTHLKKSVAQDLVQPSDPESSSPGPRL